MAAQSFINAKKRTFCSKHPKCELFLTCDDCGDIPVCSLCISTTHKGHNCTDLSITAQLRCIDIQDINNTHRNETIPKIERNEETEDVIFEQFQDSILSEIKIVEETRKRLKDHLDERADEVVYELRESLQKYSLLHAQFKLKSSECKEQLLRLIDENEEVLRTNDQVLLVDTDNQLSETQLPVSVTLPSLKFMTETNQCIAIRNMFGYVSEIEDKIPTKLLENAVLQESSALSVDPRGILVRNDGTIIICGYSSSKLLEKKPDGSSFFLQLEPNNIVDIALNPKTDQLFLVVTEKGNCVKLLDSNGYTETMFMARPNVKCLAISYLGNILVTSYSKNLAITEYTTNGEILHSRVIQNIHEPKQMAICPRTSRLALAVSKTGVIVLDKSLNELFRYPGPKEKTKGMTINAMDITFNRFGDLLVLDSRSSLSYEIHLLEVYSSSVCLLKTVLSRSLDNARCFTIDKKDQLIVCTTGLVFNNLQKFKYLEKRDK